MESELRALWKELQQEGQEVKGIIQDLLGIQRQPVVRERRVPRVPSAQAGSSRFRPIKRESLVITRPEALWIDRGWHRDGNEWRGEYSVGDRRWSGFAEDVSGYYDFYIENPPQAIKDHHCFVRKRANAYFVHFEPARPSSLSVGISGVEYQLARALGITY